MTLQEAISKFGHTAKRKLSSPIASGAPEDQLRTPLEGLVGDLAGLAGLTPGDIVMVGEASLSDLKTRPGYAVTKGNALIGFIEVKAPGKGADPRRFQDPHDREQWAKLQSLPNLIYTDGNAFSLWRDGALVGQVVHLEGDVCTAGSKLAAVNGLAPLFANFFQWEPLAPRSAAQLAAITARLCRLLREEVTEQLERKSPSLTNLAKDWRKLLFPSATDAAFADGYAQAVTFGLLMARARNITLAHGLDRVAYELRQTNTLIGSALRLLTDDADSQATLKTSLATLSRVLDAVDWPAVSKGDPEAWLYFYEDFLSAYDNDLRKKTGSYYTPPEVVRAMVRLVDEALQSQQRFGLSEGLASPDVIVADPAVGTGTYLLGILRRIADATAADQGPGAVPGVIEAAVARLIGFEIQFGPFAVAQLRILAELQSLLEDAHAEPAMRLFVTDTLGNPYIEEEYLPQILMPLGESRRRADEIKRQEKITVVIGNPPYKEKAKGRGGWIEGGTRRDEEDAPLQHWMPPPIWGVSTHAKHLRNLYVYFWRWATRQALAMVIRDRTARAWCRLSRLRASSTVRASRRCAPNCAGMRTRSGSSTVRRKAINLAFRRGSSRACSTPFASSWCSAARTPARPPRRGFVTGYFRRDTETPSLRRWSKSRSTMKDGSSVRPTSALPSCREWRELGAISPPWTTCSTTTVPASCRVEPGSSPPTAPR